MRYREVIKYKKNYKQMFPPMDPYETIEDIQRRKRIIITIIVSVLVLVIGFFAYIMGIQKRARETGLCPYCDGKGRTETGQVCTECGGKGFWVEF